MRRMAGTFAGGSPRVARWAFSALLKTFQWAHSAVDHPACSTRRGSGTGKT
jgi:hypothetical protein